MARLEYEIYRLAARPDRRTCVGQMAPQRAPLRPRTGCPAILHDRRPDILDMQALLRSRCPLLLEPDRLLLQLYLDTDWPCSRIAAAFGVSESTVIRRIELLAARLTTGKYIRCLRNRRRLTNAQMQIARDRYLHGLKLRVIARRYRLTVHCVRSILRSIDRTLAPKKRHP